MPQLRASVLRTCGIGVNASSGIWDRSRDIRRAESPLWVNVTRYFTPSVSPTSARINENTELHGLDGVLPDAGLAGEHHRVGAVQERAVGVRVSGETSVG